MRTSAAFSGVSSGSEMGSRRASLVMVPFGARWCAFALRASLQHAACPIGYSAFTVEVCSRRDNEPSTGDNISSRVHGPPPGRGMRSPVTPRGRSRRWLRCTRALGRNFSRGPRPRLDALPTIPPRSLSRLSLPGGRRVRTRFRPGQCPRAFPTRESTTGRRRPS
jgi:hypothetical protein